MLNQVKRINWKWPKSKTRPGLNPWYVIAWKLALYPLGITGIAMACLYFFLTGGPGDAKDFLDRL